MKLIILTDHRNHSAENALYTLAPALAARPGFDLVVVASRHSPENDHFFRGKNRTEIFASPVDRYFAHSLDGKYYQRDLLSWSPEQFDAVFLRLPPPLTERTATLLAIKIMPSKVAVSIKERKTSLLA